MAGENDGMRCPRGCLSSEWGPLHLSGDHELGQAGPGGSSALTQSVSLSRIQAMGVKTALPAAELGLYSLVLSGALGYAGRGLFEASQGNSWAPGQRGGTVLPLGVSGLHPARPET